MRKLLLLITVNLIGANIYCQDFSNKGKNFWISYPEHINGTNSLMGLYITSDVNTSGVITVNGVNIPFTVVANSIAPLFLNSTGTGTNVVGLNTYIHLGGLQDGIKLDAAVHVTSLKPVVVYAHIINAARSGATLVLPTTVWGKEYIAPSYVNSGGAGVNQGYGEINIMAALPNTVVEITPSIATRGGTRAAGVPYQITLVNPGDVYQVQFPQNTDLSGTKIKSLASAATGCPPIAVFSATTWSAINCNNGNGGDNFYQQLFPTGAWGKEFITTPLKKTANVNDHNNDIVRIYVKNPATVVRKTENGVTTTLAGLTAGGFYEYTTEFPTYIQADQPIEVIEFVKTQACGTFPSVANPTQSDPEMIALSAVEQTINDITVYSAINTAVPGGNSQINIHYINVTMKTANTGSFKINGAAPGSSFTAIPGTNYSYLKQNIPVGTPISRLTADSGFSAIAYGFGSVESYGYNAGTNVKDLYQQIGVSTQYGIEPTPSVCKGSPFRFKVSLPYCVDSMSWDLSNLPGPPVAPPTQIYTTCTPGAGGPDSTTVVNGKTLYWYSLPNLYTFNTSGTYPVTITTNAPNTDGCGSIQEINFDLNVFDPPIADFVWITPGCAAEAVQFTDNTETPRPSYIWNWDFGDPASGPVNNVSTLRNPTHIFSGPGTYNVKFWTITTPGCISSEIIKQVTVAPIPTATITGTTTVCINDPMPTITFTAANGTAPYTFSYHINAGPAIHLPSPTNTITVAVPTGVAGTFTYYLDSVKNTGSTLCVTSYNNVSAVVTVNANTGLALTAGSNNQAVCENTAIGNIDYTISGGGNNATASGLPPGVTGVYVAGIFTISGTPTTPGTYNYTVTATGLCLPNSLTGTITVNPDAAISLTTANNTQALCINVPISDINYNIIGGGTGGTVSGLPTGVTGSYSGGVFTITGTPTVTGTFNYTVTTTGTCVQKTATGTITVNPDATLALSSPAATANQAVCENVAIANITYNVGGGGTGGTVSGLPPGVTGVYAAGVITISGIPTTVGTYNFTVNTTGTCIQRTANGSITVNPDAAIVLTSAASTNNQVLCMNSTLTNILYTITGGGTGAIVSGLPAGVTGSYAGGVFTITGAPTVSGTFNYTVTTTGTCVQKSATGTITVNQLPAASFTFTAPSCETRLITFTNTSSPNAAGVTQWQWNFGDPASGALNTSTLFSPTHIFATASATPYTVTLSVTNSNGCISNPVASIPVTINNRPQAGFMVPEVCINDAATVFTDTSHLVGTFDPAGYYWNFGDPASGAANTSTAMHGSHLYTSIGLYNVMHVVTSSLGCKDTIYQDIFINAADPVSDFTVSNLATLCSNDSVSLVNKSTISQGSVTKLEIYWDVVGAPATFDVVNVPVFNGVYKHKYPTLQTTQNYTVRMVAYSGAICFTNKTVVLTVNAAPKVQFNTMPDVCLDAVPFQITQASEIGGVPGTATYAGPGVNATGLFNPALAGVGTHTIKYTFTSSAAGCIDSLSKTITVLDSASARFTFPATNCEASPVSFNSTSSTIPLASGTITGWTWDFGDPASGAANTSVLQNPTHLFSGWGNYTVKLFVTTSNGCRSTVRTMQVFINPLPRPDFLLPASSCLPSANVTFNSSPSSIPDGTQASFSYLWNFGDPASGALNTATGSSPSHIYNTAGPFNVNLQITSGAGCVNNKTIRLSTIHPQPTGSFTSDKTDLCVGESFRFTDNSNPADGTTTQWNWTMGDANTRTTSAFNYTYATAGSYNVSLYITNSFGCRSTTFTKTVTVNPYPIVNAGPDLFILQDGNDTIQPIITAINPTYLWTPNFYFLSSNTVMNPIVKGVEDITYTLTVTGRGGCVSTDQVFIKVLKGPEIPNIFSPNGDGQHDTWVIKYLDTYPGGTVDIFNRYGQLIFHSVGYSVPWDGKIDGKDVPIGTYYYIVNPKNGRKIMSGYVDVIR